MNIHQEYLSNSSQRDFIKNAHHFPVNVERKPKMMEVASIEAGVVDKFNSSGVTNKIPSTGIISAQIPSSAMLPGAMP